ncbi:MAG TPA: hypothetical protein VJV78_08130 [Polyangiales bacterium]|nr:hypothetical protein [Polyangiales bacterium]
MDSTRGRESHLAFSANSEPQAPAAVRCISRALDDAGNTRETVLRATPSLIAFAGDDRAYEPCDRRTLLAVLDSYLGGLSQGDPRRVPFTANVRATEDCMPSSIGAGLWRSAPRLRTFRHVVADAARGQVCCQVLLDVGGDPVLLSLRLKLEGRRIGEVESLLTRRGQAALFAPEQLEVVDPIFERILPPEQRASQQELRAAVESYFDGIERCDASRVPWHPACWRTQNGVLTGSPSKHFAQLSYIERVDRRYCAIDEERGLVWGIFTFQIPGSPGQAPRTTFIGSSFKLESGRIRAIQAFVRNTPYGTPPAW